MNIILTLEAYKPYTNGVITHVSMLRDSLIKQGHNVLIVTADPKVHHHTIIDGVLHCPAITMKNIYGYGLATPFSKKRIKILNDFKPDIIHTHNELSMGIFSLVYARKFNIPLCYTLHTMYEDYSHYLAKNKITKSAVKYCGSAYFKLFAKKSDLMISPSDKANEFMDFIGVKNKKIHIIPNSIDVDYFDPSRTTSSHIQEIREELGFSTENFIGLFIGRLGEEKSVDVLIKGWCEKFKDSKKHKLLIIGEGPEKNNLINLAKSCGDSENIIFTGKIDHSNVYKYFCISNYFITASLTEMMSISMLESMSMGLPAILRRDPRNENQINEGKNGFIRDTIEEMTEVVENISKLPTDEYLNLRKTTREHAIELGSDKNINTIIKLYEETIKKYNRKTYLHKKLK